jgi:hypothetical protein
MKRMRYSKVLLLYDKKERCPNLNSVFIATIFYSEQLPNDKYCVIEFCSSSVVNNLAFVRKPTFYVPYSFTLCYKQFLANNDCVFLGMKVLK